MYPTIRYYHILEIFGLEVFQLEDTRVVFTREAFEALKLENKNIDYLMR